MSYMPPSPAPPQQNSSNRTLWIILGSIGAVGVCSLLCIVVGVFGALSVLGTQTSAVFSEIERELEAGNSTFALPTTEPVDVSAAIAVGTAKRAGDLEITVTDARIVNGESGIEPEEFFDFIAVDLRITNVGAEAASLTDIELWSRIQDSYELTYDCCVFGLSNTAPFEQELAAGAAIEAELVYEVEIADDGEILFWIHEDSASGERVIVRLEQFAERTSLVGLRR